jgi:hypothetical protein
MPKGVPGSASAALQALLKQQAEIEKAREALNAEALEKARKIAAIKDIQLREERLALGEAVQFLLEDDTSLRRRLVGVAGKVIEATKGKTEKQKTRLALERALGVPLQDTGALREAPEASAAA